MNKNRPIGMICMAGTFMWAITVSAVMLEDFEPGTSYSGPGTVQVDPDNAGNQVLFLAAEEVATFIPPAFAGIITMKIYDFGEIPTGAGNGPRWGIADGDESAAIGVIQKNWLQSDMGYAKGNELSRSGPWYSPRFFNGPRQVIALDDPLTTEIFEGIGQWTVWTFKVATDGGVTISSIIDSQLYETVDAMDVIWVSGGRAGQASHGVLVDDITFEDLPTAASDYLAWANSFGMSNAVAALDYDVEPDGMDNLLEYALGGNPTNDDAVAILPTAILVGGDTWEYVYRRQRDAATLELVYDLQYNADIGTTNWISSAGAFETGTNTADSTFDVVTNTVPLSMLPGVDQSFMKLEVRGLF